MGFSKMASFQKKWLNHTWYNIPQIGSLNLNDPNIGILNLDAHFNFDIQYSCADVKLLKKYYNEELTELEAGIYTVIVSENGISSQKRLVIR